MLAVRADIKASNGAYAPWPYTAGLDSGQVIRWKSWYRWTAICLLAYIYLAVAVALQRQQEAGSDHAP